MASRPDYLRTYEAQSFPYLDADAPFVPPADYPTEVRGLGSARQPRIPPLDYNKRDAYAVKYPFRTYGDGHTQRHPQDIVRTTAEANRVPVQPSRHDHAIVRRHTTRPAIIPRSESPVHPRQGGLKNNKAFLHHLKNFDKFATIKGRAACCAECPICKAINAANVVLEEDEEEARGVRARSGWQMTSSPYPPDPGASVDQPSAAVDPESYQKQNRQRSFLRDMARRGAKPARVTADRVARHVSELTVTNGEYVEVLDDHRGDRWWACSNISGQLGYVPSNYLQAVGFDEFTLSGR